MQFFNFQGMLLNGPFKLTLRIPLPPGGLNIYSEGRIGVLTMCSFHHQKRKLDKNHGIPGASDTALRSVHLRACSRSRAVTNNQLDINAFTSETSADNS